MNVFQSFTSHVDASFFATLALKKLNEYRLDVTAHEIQGQYSNSNNKTAINSAFYVSDDSFSTRLNSVESDNGPSTKTILHCVTSGALFITNTYEEFKQFDRVGLLQRHLQDVARAITCVSTFEDFAILTRFSLITYADLKSHRYYYWFLFPALHTVSLASLSLQNSHSLTDWLNGQTNQDTLKNNLFQQLDKILFEKTGSVTPFFGVVLTYSSTDQARTLLNIEVISLINWHSRLSHQSIAHETSVEYGVGLIDASASISQMSWSARNFLALVLHHFGVYFATNQPHLPVFAFRDITSLHSEFNTNITSTTTNPHTISDHFLATLQSRVFILNIAPLNIIDNGEGVTGSGGQGVTGSGWERNLKNTFGPRMIDLAATMDPLRLAEASVDLNLRLLKWRLLPGLDLEIIGNQKCLLLGAGTLGCSVARVLMAWGVRDITFVDQGHVSYSNPVRQSLFYYRDCIGSTNKAIAAADALKEIFPLVRARGVCLSIPMPGHVHDIDSSISPDNLRHEMSITQVAFNELDTLIQQHDVIYLLTDSRESRWLPTVLAQKNSKITVNVALGFDNFVVLRHGLPAIIDSLSSLSNTVSSEKERLSCYFCADIVAPANSLRNASLDEQCTVTRPGLASMASAVAVELMAALLQHPGRARASADASGCLGAIPHQIRGYLNNFELKRVKSRAFDRCTACSDYIFNQLKLEGYAFIQKALSDPSYLEELTGLKQLQDAAENADVEWDDEI